MIEADYSISVLGAPTSGKTTLLAALSIALARQNDGWKLVGTDRASRERLVTLTDQLTGREFPKPTQGIEEFTWLLIGQTMRDVPRKWFGTKQIEDTLRIRLDLADPSGEISTNQNRHVNRDELIKNLINSRGIVFIFDPISEFERGDAFRHTFGVLAEMAQLMVDSPEFADGYLPHHVAVCVTKFDEIRIFQTAQQADLVTYDSDDLHGFPRVDNEDARELFARLCAVSRSQNADLVINTLEQHFRKDRIRYFVTSAIGFHVDPATGVFSLADYQNNVRDLQNQPGAQGKPGVQGNSGAQARIRGPVYPINVIEPLKWVSAQLTRTSGE